MHQRRNIRSTRIGVPQAHVPIFSHSQNLSAIRRKLHCQNLRRMAERCRHRQTATAPGAKIEAKEMLEIAFSSRCQLVSLGEPQQSRADLTALAKVYAFGS